MIKDWKAGIHVTPKSEIKKTNSKGIKSKAYLRAQVMQFTTLFASGFDRAQIIELMELGPSEYEKLAHVMLQTYEKEIEATSPQKAFAHYVIRLTSNMRELQQMKGKLANADGTGLSDPKKAQAFLGAIKVQSDMADRIIKTGLELGVLQRSSKGPGTIEGYDPRDVGDKKLGEIVEAQLAEARKISEKKNSRKKRADNVYVLKPKKTGTED